MSEETTDFQTIWKTLSEIDIKSFTKKKKVEGKEFGYIPWAVAWAAVVKIYPNATHDILCDDTGFPCFIKDGVGAFCKTSITINEYTRSMDLPVLNFSNKAMKLEGYTYTTKFSGEKAVAPINSFEINTTKWRCLVKNLTMFGFGISLFANLDWENQEDTEDEVPWETARKRKIGRGKNEDKTWIELEGKSLKYYVDKKQKYYSEWYAIRAQKEIDWRAGRQGDEDFESDKPDSLKNLRADVQSIADDVLKTKYKKEIQYDEYTRIIKEADSKEKLITISARIEAIDILIKAFFAKQINGKEYLKYLTKISIADNNGIDILASELYTLDPEAKKNRDLLVHYWNEIEGVHKKLGYTDNPSLALNSMKKHLGTNDMHSIFDVKKLQTYFEYLENKLKTKPAKVEDKTVIVKATVAKEDDTMNVR